MTLVQNRIICPQIHLIRKDFPCIQAEESRGEEKKKKAIFKFKWHLKKGKFYKMATAGLGERVDVPFLHLLRGCD